MENATGVKGAADAAHQCAAAASRVMGRRTLYVAAGVGVTAGVFLGWDWLVAVGAASVILALAPCLVMCALGLCVSRACHKTNPQAPAQATQISVQSEQRP